MKFRLTCVLMILMFVVACTPAQTKDKQIEEKIEEVSGDVPSTEPSTSVEEKIQEIEQKIDDVEEKVQSVDESKVDKPKEPSVIVESGEKEEKEAEAEVPPAPVADSTKQLSDEMSDEVKELITKADNKVTSYQFTLAEPPLNLARDVWKVKGTRIKVQLYDDNFVTPGTYFDSIYIDTAKKIAKGFCESQKTVRCADPDQVFDLDYDEVMIKTPYQWVKSIKAPAELISTEMLWDRKVMVVQYMEDGVRIKQWIDGFSGLPVKIELKQEGKDPIEWGFRYLAINNVLDKELEMVQKMQENY